jgi:hypothetical protein
VAAKKRLYFKKVARHEWEEALTTRWRRRGIAPSPFSGG